MAKAASPPPADIQWTVTNGAGPLQFNSLKDLNVQPIDLVLLAGDQLGQLSTELERFIVRLFRLANKVDDAAITRVAPLAPPADAVPPLVFDFAASAAGKHSLAALQPLLERLRQMIVQSRAMHALDWLPPADLKTVDATDPTGSANGDAALVKLKDLNDRLDSGAADLQATLNVIDAARIALTRVQARVDDLLNGLLRAHLFGDARGSSGNRNRALRCTDRDMEQSGCRCAKPYRQAPGNGEAAAVALR